MKSTIRSTILAAAALAALPGTALADGIAMNFAENASNQVFAGGTPIGPALSDGTKIDSANWNSSINRDSGTLAAGTKGSLIDSNGTATTASVTWSSTNVWWNGDGTGSDEAKLAVGYLDDGGTGATFTVSNIPYAKYNVYVLFTSDSNGDYTHGTLTIDGTAYLGGPFPAHGRVTDGTGWVLADGTVKGNYAKVNDLTNPTLTVSATKDQGRSPITGFIIEEALPAGCPKGLTCATSIDPATVNLNWTAASGLDLTGIEVLRDGAVIATLAANADSYTDNPTLPAGPGYKTYEYTVQAVGNDAGTCLPLTCSATFYLGDLPDDSVLHLPLESDGADISGLANNGTVNGTPTFETGQIGNAASFDDLADPAQYVSVPPAASLAFGSDTDFTVSAWINDNNLPFSDPSVILTNKDWTTANNTGWGLGASIDGALQWNIADGASSVAYTGTDGELSGGAWHHVVVTHQRTGVAVLYLDGAEVARRNISGIGSVDSGLPLTVGHDATGQSNPFPGLIDDVIVWRRALTESEVAKLHTLGTSGNTITHSSPPKICPAFLQATLSSADPYTVDLQWLGAQNLDSTGIEILRNGTVIGTAAADATTFTDMPTPPATGTIVEYTYSIRMTGGADSANCPELAATGPVSIFAGPIESNVELYLPMDGNVADLSGHSATTSVNGTPTYVAGKVGQAIRLDNPAPLAADPQYVNAGSAENLNFGTDRDMTVAAWVRTDTLFPNDGTNHNDPAIASNKNWNSGANQGWFIGGGSDANTEGRLQWNIGDGAGPAGRMDYDGPAHQLTGGDWHHVVWVLDRDTETRTYLDGVLVNTQGPTDAFDISTPDGFQTRIGTDGEAGATWPAYFPGDIDEVAIWSRPLLPYEVAKLYDMGLAGTPILTPGDTIAITAITTDPAANQVTLTWTSTAAGPFDIQASTDLVDFGETLASGVTSPHTLTLPASLAGKEKVFFRVVAP